MKTSKVGQDLISEFEETRLTAYKDPVGIWTIGRGHTGPEARAGNTITAEQEQDLFELDLTGAERALMRSLPPGVEEQLPQECWDALVSATFNLGTRLFYNKDNTQTGLRRALAEGRIADVPNQLRRFCYAGGRKLPGLIRRREAEAHLFEKGLQAHRPGEAGVEADDVLETRPLLKTKTAIGAVTTGSGVALAELAQPLADTAQQLSPLAQVLPTLQLVAALLTVGGIMLTLYGRWHALQKEKEHG